MTYNYDPELRDFAAMAPDFSFEDPAAARAGLAAMVANANAGLDATAINIDETFIEGPQGAGVGLRVRIYSPKRPAASTVPALLCLHAGGFVIGDLDTEHASIAGFCERLGIVVVSVDYRLAPEHPYPAALDDCYCALQWLHAQAGDLGVDRSRIGVYGLSAGGALAAALTLLARDRGGPALCFQYLGVPVLDDRMDSVSMRTFVDTPLWNRPTAALSWKYYLGAAYEPGAVDIPAYAAPARATDVSRLPPTYIVAAEFDPLRDENIAYAVRLLEAGVPVELHVYSGTFHGSQINENAKITQRQQRETLEVLKRGLRIA